MTTKQVIALEDDIVEIMYNSSLSKKPYLIRLTNYNRQIHEMRADEQDLIELQQIFDQFISNNDLS